MLKSFLNVTLLVVFVLCLISASVFCGGILPKYTLLLYRFFGPLAVLWAVKLFCYHHIPVVCSPAHIPVFLFAGYAILRYAASPIEYDSRIELLHIGLYTLVYFVACCNFYRSRLIPTETRPSPWRSRGATAQFSCILLHSVAG